MAIRKNSLFVRIHARLHADERGFSMIEAMIAGFVLAIGAFGVAQALDFGLNTTGIARQRSAAEALANQQLELARTLNYDNVVLRTDQPVTYDANPESPDHCVTDGTPPLFDPDCAGPLGNEPILSQDVFPSLLHYQTDLDQGNTNFTVYTYVTWVDSPTDGLGAADAAHDWDGDGIVDDASGHDQKRVTMVVTWPNPFGTTEHELRMSSVFSIGTVPYQAAGTSTNQAPAVTCPDVSVDGLTVALTAHATDVDGTVDRIDWDFGDGTDPLENGGPLQSYTYDEAGTYEVNYTAYDDDGATASTSGCSSFEVIDDSAGSTDLSCSIQIENGAAYATTAQVTLYLASTTGAGVPATQMQFSTNGVDFGAAVTYAATTLHTLSPGDGTKTVYVRFLDAGGKLSAPCSDTIILDTTLPGAPSSLQVKRKGQKADLQWVAPAPLPGDFAGYRIWRRATTSSTWLQITCNYSGSTACQDPNLLNQTNYEYYVVAVDLAGNQSAQSNHVTV